MILSDRDILDAINKGEIIIDPFLKENLGPCSIDLTLSDEFLIFGGDNLIDPKNLDSMQRNTKIVKTGNKPFIIRPKQFVLASIRERIKISTKYAATLEGRSSVARLGIVVHAAGLVNPGTGEVKPKPLILEIFCQNTTPVMLYPGMRIVQILFHKLTSPSSISYDRREKSTFHLDNRWIKFRL